MGTEKKVLNLYEKIQEVAKLVMNIEKNMTVGVGKYTYQAVSDQDVTLAVKRAEQEFRIVSIPMSQELLHSEAKVVRKKNGDEGLIHIDNIMMTTRFVDLDCITSHLDVQSLGKGIDSGDKGLGKASTYARKYGLLNAYKIATGEDPDANKSQEELIPKTVSEKTKLVTDYLNTDNNKLLDVLKHFSVAEVGDLTEANINTLYVAFKKKGQI